MITFVTIACLIISYGAIYWLGFLTGQKNMLTCVIEELEQRDK